MRKIFSVVLVAVWMSIIFYLSSQSGYESHQTSKIIVQKVYKHVETRLYRRIDIEKINFYFRKNAHFAEFALLALLIYFLLKSYNLKHKAFLSFIICLIFALSDEMHQMFTPNRSPSIIDVFIDISGSLLMLTVIYTFRKITRRIADEG